VLEVRDVAAGYDGVTVLRGVSLCVPDGHVVALLGANGAGKTTLLRTVAGVVRARSGSVILDGEDVTRQPLHRRARRGLCHIADGRAVFPSLSVRENLLLLADPGDPGEAIARATEVFPVLGNRLKQVAGSLSGGEQQMLAVVRAYLRRPRLVLIDEASMGLAPLVVDQIYDFLHQLVDRGTSILLVEQYVTKALDLAHEAYILSKGSIAFDGAASDLAGVDIFREYLGIDVGSAS